jgi:SAM-dependent methyltransferase
MFIFEDMLKGTPMTRPRVSWNAGGFDYGDFRFLPNVSATIGEADMPGFPAFIIMKTADLIAGYEDCLTGEYNEVLELGVMKGGSCALFEAMFTPRNHLAIDVYGFPGDGLAELTDYVAQKGRNFRVDYQTSQSDIPRILQLWNEMTGVNAPTFDLVIDDASHSYGLSLASFNGLFPLLKPGGVYALEDWGWAHWAGPWQETSNSEFNSPSLSNLVVHAALSVTGGNGMIKSIQVTPNTTFIVRGSNPSKEFKVEESYLARGRNGTYY